MEPAGESDLRFVSFFPAEGDTAIAELMSGDDLWGDLRLEGILLSASGAARTANAVVWLRLFPPPEGRSYWDFTFDDAQKSLSRARAWLMENEHGRTSDTTGGT